MIVGLTMNPPICRQVLDCGSPKPGGVSSDATLLPPAGFASSLEAEQKIWQFPFTFLAPDALTSDAISRRRERPSATSSLKRRTLPSPTQVSTPKTLIPE